MILINNIFNIDNDICSYQLVNNIHKFTITIKNPLETYTITSIFKIKILNYGMIQFKIGYDYDIDYLEINHNHNNININSDIFKNINDEYQMHLTIKNNMINDLKDFYKLYLHEF